MLSIVFNIFNFKTSSAALEKGGVGALELVAMELKARLDILF